MRSKFALLGICLLCALVGCKDRGDLKQSVSGKAGEVLVVAPKEMWEGDFGQQLRLLLAKEYAYLPQSEPSFTLIHITEGAFTPIFQKHRNIILCHTLSDLPGAQLTLQRDVWASPQWVATLSGPTVASLEECFADQSEKIYSALEQVERDRLIQNSKRFEEVGLRRAVTQFIGGSPYFPKGYSLKKQTDNFMWITYETTYTTQGVFVYTYPYRSEADLSLSRIIAERNLILEQEVPGPTEGSYMTTHLSIEPGLKRLKYAGREFVEVRGLWDVKNDFMAGPFVLHCFLDTQNSKVIVLDAFAYAPRFEKRNYLRQVESIIYSFEWQNL